MTDSCGDAGIECVDCRLIFGDPGYAEVGVDSAGFNEGLVHRADCLFVLCGDGLQRASSFAGIAEGASEQSQVSGGIDEDAELQFFAKCGNGEQQNSFEQNHGCRVDGPGVCESAVCGVIVDWLLDGMALQELVEVQQEQAVFE